MYILKRFLCKKEMKKNKDKLLKKDEEIGRLNRENKELREKYVFESERFKRIEYLIKENPETTYSIEKTKKGFNVLIFIKETNIYINIKVFDIDGVSYNRAKTLELKAEVRCIEIIDKTYEIFINDIQGGSRKRHGHGTCAMNHLISYAKKNNIKRITGKLSNVDFGHKERLFAFYRKFGFTISLNDKGDEEKIEKKLY